MRDLTLRPATSEDAAAIFRVWRRSVEATHTFLAPEDIDALEAEIPAYLGGVDLIVAERGGEVVGFLGTAPGPEGVSVEMLFVFPLGAGVGTALLDTVPRRAVVDVNEQNPSGRRFYAGKGFVEVGRSEVDGQGRPFPLLHLRRD
jgi:putative acetyltransferase